ncbi:transglycosylase domain-containing protein [Patescibacteria group bacterium]|nr:transglycosylase domain-containing protein [Patescibacteria group bacterium]
MFIFLIGALRFYVAIVRTLPELSDINQSFKQTTIITDRNGEVLYKLYDENREYVSYDNISPHAVNAIIAAEDKDFWNNEGVDYSGILRAVWLSVKNGSLSGPGGSTITQQLIKLLLLSNEKTLTRKAKEIILATKLDDYLQNQVSKEKPNLSSVERKKEVKKRIVEMYLNYIFLGNNSN